MRTQSSGEGKREFDVVISGGAMTGSTLALILDQVFAGSLSIAVVDPYLADEHDHPGFDSRSIALSYGTVQLLKRFSLWDEIAKVATPIQTISVTDQGHAGMTEFSAHEQQLEALGYVVELADIGRIYDHLLGQCTSIERFTPNRIVDIERFESHVDVFLEHGETLTAKLLVGADGALSDCCQMIGLPLDSHDFQQVALIANVGLSQAHHGQAFERFTTNGPLALLPMSHNRMSLVWCVSPQQADELSEMDPSEFLQALQENFGWRLGKFSKVGETVAYSLIMRSRRQTISHRFAVVGNAAQTLHPIAGQGFNLGIRDVVSLVESLSQGMSKSEYCDVGEYRRLSLYQQRRHTDRDMTMKMTSSLVHAFSNRWLPSMVMRNLGLMAMDTIPGMNQPLLQRTLGLVSR